MSDTLAVYRAEAVVRSQLECREVTVAGTRVVIPVERRFAGLDDVQRYVDKVLGLNWVRAGWPGSTRTVAVVRSRKINRATCAGGKMFINPDWERWAMREHVVLHELAHHLTEPLSDPAHGPGFRACLIDLAAELIGSEIGWLQRIAYLDQGLAVH